jgi:hypothetical protein
MCVYIYCVPSLEGKTHSKLVIFHSHVKLPDGKMFQGLWGDNSERGLLPQLVGIIIPLQI